MAASIRVAREPSPWADRLRAYKVTVDGQVVGSVRHGEQKAFDVAPGRHWVQLRIDWCRSQPLEVDVEDGSEVRLVCRSRDTLSALYCMVMRYDQYVILEPAGAG